MTPHEQPAATWHLFTGAAAPHAVQLPDAPPWRRFGSDEATAPAFAAGPAAVAATAALLVRRQILRRRRAKGSL